MILCNIEVGRNGNEWVAIVSYATGKVAEFHHTAFGEVALAVTKELEELD